MGSLQAGFDGIMKIGAVVVDLARDVRLEQTRESIDVSSRDQDGFADTLAGLLQWSATLELLRRPGNAGNDLIQSAFDNGTDLDNVAFIDADGAEIKGTMSVTRFDEEQDLDEPMVIRVTLQGRGPYTRIP